MHAKKSKVYFSIQAAITSNEKKSQVLLLIIDFKMPAGDLRTKIKIINKELK